MKKRIQNIALLAACGAFTLSIVFAADAVKTPTQSAAVEKVEDLQKERDTLKAKVGELEQSVNQLQKLVVEANKARWDVTGELLKAQDKIAELNAAAAKPPAPTPPAEAKK